MTKKAWPIVLLAITGLVSTASAQNSGTDLGTSLSTACWKGDLPEVSRLLARGAPLEQRDALGRTPLFLACHGSPEIVKLLLAHGAKVDVVAANGDTTIGRACEYGDLASAEMLKAAGADINRTNQFGRTPLMLASREGHDDVVAWLIDQHIDVNFHETSSPALCYAAGGRHLSTVKLLLAAGARTDIPTIPNVAEKEPLTALSLAALHDDLPMLELLLVHGAPINERDEMGFTSLLIASLHAKSETIQFLLDRTADINLADNTGQTPLMAISENQSVELVRLFLKRGAKLEDRDDAGRTALIRTAMIGADDQLRELVAAKANVNAADNRGETALTYAGDRGNMKIVLLLKKLGAERTDLHIIVKNVPQSSLSVAHHWALAVGAIYYQVNGDSQDLLALKNSTFVPRRMLHDQWSIDDRAGVIRNVNALLQGPTFPATLAEQLRDSLSESGLENKEIRGFQLLFLDLWWRGRTNVAWNLCRAANLVYSGVASGYLKEEEAWPLLMPIARRTQATFSSWNEMSDNFLDSREIHANERSGDFRVCARLLLNPKDPNSPWNQLKWKTDLSRE